jgi:hypothetical protein
MKDQVIDQKYLNKVSSETMYFWNDEDECFIKSVPGGGFYAKFKGIAEYQIEGTTDMVINGVMSGRVATKSEYEKY